MTRTETLPYALLIPSKGGDEPSGEYVEARQIPNASTRVYLDSGEPITRMGILQLTLCSVPGQYEIVYRERAGQVAEAFRTDYLPAIDGVTVQIVKADVAQGFADGQHWRVPVSVYYRTHA
jgi:hypothetical protein